LRAVRHVDGEHHHDCVVQSQHVVSHL
jgi:hypothetical protein